MLNFWNRFVFVLLAGLLLVVDSSWGQLGQFGAFADMPVEITADGETRFEGGVATAEDNVQIHYQEISIYSDYAEYNPDTRDILLVGNIRIYTPEGLLTGQRALFNLETRQMRALEFRGEFFPLRFRAFSMRAPSLREFRIRDAYLTTDDSSEPDFHVKTRTVRIYDRDRVVLVNSTLYVKDIPIFWFPYLFASLNNTGFEFLPGYDTRWGAFLLTAYSFPIGDGTNIIGKVHSDYRTELGYALGFDADLKFGKNDRSTGKFISYHAWDVKPDRKVGGPGEPDEAGDQNRYRVTFRQTLFLTDDIYALIDINRLSDVDFLEDFFPSEFRVDPQPDNHITLTKWEDFYTLSAVTRFQLNPFFDVTERLPELAADIKEHRIFGWPIYYSGETSGGYYRRRFPEDSSLPGGTTFPDYESGRLDTFHQISSPQLLFNWLSVVPRAGFRATYYSRSGSFQSVGDGLIDPTSPNSVAFQLQDPDQLISPESNPLNTPTRNLKTSGAILRPVINAEIESSFKLSRTFEAVQSRFLGLDGLRHVAQPYTIFSGVLNAGSSPDRILQFDRVVPSTQLLPITFPEFTALDSIDSWLIWRLGMRNRLLTRRSNATLEWLSLDSFLDVNAINPYSDSDVSNFFNVLRFHPLPWLTMVMGSQVPVTDQGFTEIDYRFEFMPYRDLLLSLGQQYIENTQFFNNSNQFNIYGYWRVNDHWAFSVFEQYEAVQQLLLYQNYLIHRDLSSWVLSFGAQVRQSEGVQSSQQTQTDISFLFILSLKDAPQVTLQLPFNVGAEPLAPEGSSSSY